MYIYTTTDFDEKVKQFRLERFIDDLRAKLTSEEEIDKVFQPYPPYWKIRRAKLYRLFAKPVKVNNEVVLCFIALYMRKSNEYKRLIANHRAVLDPLVPTEETIKEWLDKQSPPPPPSSKDSLPNTLQSWLTPPKWLMESAKEDLLIYENEEWVLRFRQQAVTDYWQTYHKLLSGIAQQDPYNAQQIKDPYVFLTSVDNCAILYMRQDSNNTILLIAPLRAPFEEDDVQKILRDNELIQTNEDNRSSEHLLRRAVRAYPAFVLADEDTWLAIERGNEANLALSPEEENLLQEISSGSVESTQLPVFINGRAGSGKSTMLFYLFADYCYRKWRGNEPLPLTPLFLTYSEPLLDAAQKSIVKLLSTHHRFLTEDNTNLPLDEIKTYLAHFRTFLLDLLPSTVKSEFATNNLITFNRFKQLFHGQNLPESERGKACRLAERQRYSAEFCWHIIRTFIKGYEEDDFLSPQKYTTISSKEQTISKEAYQDVFETIWEKWYKQLTEEGDFWDDQDLVRTVLMLQSFEPKYTAIFCDESQDFTRLELKFLMNLSAFPQYQLEQYQVKNGIPFAFAGDPFQTLNPSGFRWSSVQATLYEMIIRSLDPTNKWHLTLNYKELAFNYRSTPPVVRVGNLVQLWRHVLLGNNDIHPQKFWQIKEPTQPQKLILNRDIKGEELTAQAVDTIIIIPVDEGQETEYVANDDVLSQLSGQEEGQPPKNILSPMAAKGLEFDRVILYKFGDAITKSIAEILRQGNENFSDEDRIELGYYFNKLYVAITRPKKLLFIVDTDTGDETLWKYAEDKELRNLFVNQAFDPDEWEPLVGGIVEGTDIDISEESPETVAAELETKGWASGNADLLRRAKLYYRSVGRSGEANICEAKALQVEDNFQQAAVIYSMNGKPSMARECYWKALQWNMLCKWYDEFEPDTQQDYRREIARFLAATENINESTDKFEAFLLWALNNGKLGQPFEQQWQAAISRYASRIIDARRGSTEQAWLQSARLLNELSDQGFFIACNTIGQTFYHGGQLQKAVGIWENCKTKTTDYYRAKAQIEGFPQSLLWLSKGKLSKEIIDAWEQAGGLSNATSRDWVTHVSPALEDTGRYWEAIKLNKATGNTQRVKSMLTKYQSNLTPPQLEEGIRFVIQAELQGDQWKNAKSTIGEFSQYLEPEQIYQLHVLIVKKIAYSQKHLNPASDERAELEELLIKVLKQPSWRTSLTMQELGAAFERIGSFIETLKFYERYTNSPNPDERQHARNRWIVTKQKQARFSRNEQQKNRTLRQLSAELTRWKMSLRDERPEFPYLPRPWNQILHGIPPGVQVITLRNGLFQVPLDDLEIKVHVDNKLVFILETETMESIRIDIKHRTIEIHGKQQHISEESFVFEAPPHVPTGTITFENSTARIRLHLEQTTLQIDL